MPPPEPNLASLPFGDPRTVQLPQSEQNQPPQGESRFLDGSDPIFQMYLEKAGREDKKMTDSWKADAKGILIFTGLFSAALAALITVSVQDLKLNSQDISAFYLAKIYQLSAASNGSQVIIPSTLLDPSLPFSPPMSAVWVNSLWFLSLAISLTCALLATLLQQWSRRYMDNTRTRYSPHKQARIREFFSGGVKKSRLPWAVAALPALLHLSLCFFFAGLAVFLFNINHTVFKVAISWIGVCTGIYTYITLMPTFRYDIPYSAPFSSLSWHLYNRTLPTVFGIARRIAHGLGTTNGGHSNDDYASSTDTDQTLFQKIFMKYHKRFEGDMEKEIEETALKASSETDGHALLWTFESLDKDSDHELENFFAGINDFRNSDVIDDTPSRLAWLNTPHVSEALAIFLKHAFAYDHVPGSTKKRRFLICVRSVDVLYLYNSDVAQYIFHLLKQEHALLGSIDIGHSLITRNNRKQEASWCERGIIAYVIAKAPQTDQHWHSLIMHHWNISEPILRDYQTHGDSVLLANLIHITFWIYRCDLGGQKVIADTLAKGILPRVSSVCVSDTLPELQHTFCHLWNEIVKDARVREHLLLQILRPIRLIYLDLHRGTVDAPSAFSSSTPDHHTVLRQPDSYPLCRNPRHRLHLVSNTSRPEGDVGRTAESTRTVPRSDAGPTFIPLIANRDGPRSTTPSLDHTMPQLALNTQQHISSAAPSSYPTPPGNDRFPDGPLTGPVQDTADPLLGSSTANFGRRSTLGGDTASTGIGNTTITARPTLNPEAGPTPTPMISEVGRADPLAPLVPVGQSDQAPHDGLVSPPSTETAASSSFAPRVNSNLDSNAITNSEMGPHDPPGDILGPNHRILSQSLMSSSSNIAEDNPRPEDRDPSENV